MTTEQPTTPVPMTQPSTDTQQQNLKRKAVEDLANTVQEIDTKKLKATPTEQPSPTTDPTWSPTEQFFGYTVNGITELYSTNLFTQDLTQIESRISSLHPHTTLTEYLRTKRFEDEELLDDGFELPAKTVTWAFGCVLNLEQDDSENKSNNTDIKQNPVLQQLTKMEKTWILVTASATKPENCDASPATLVEFEPIRGELFMEKRAMWTYLSEPRVLEEVDKEMCEKLVEFLSAQF